MIHRTVDGMRVPAIGLGTAGLAGEASVGIVRDAIDIGYRHIDTAIRYANEKEIGQAITESGIDRSEFFITSKIWFTDLADGTLQERADESLRRLKTDYLDLLLVHWPSAEVPLSETMKALGDVKRNDKARNIGLSNFPAGLLTEAIDLSDEKLACNQVEYHPFLDQTLILEHCRRNGMLLTAHTPLAKGAVLTDTILRRLATRHGKTPAQIALRWLVQQEGVIAIPRSADRGRLKQNIEIFDFSLPEEDTRLIEGLRGNGRMVNVDWAPEWDDV